MESILIELAVGLLGFAVLVGYLLTKIRRSYWLKFLLIPATLALALYMGLTIPHLLGFAYPGRPQGEFTYVSHQVDAHDKVTLVAKVHGSVRLYQFKGDPDTDAELAQARALTKAGQTVLGKFHGKIDKFGFPGLYHSMSPLEIHSPHNYGMLPPKNPTQPSN